MARLASIANGNWTAASTWGVVDSTSYLDAENSNSSVTTIYSQTRSQSFTPGAIEIAGVAVKFRRRVGTTGTLSVRIYNVDAAAGVSGTEVTIDMTDVPAVTADEISEGGWLYFKFSAPVTLLAATNYAVEAACSTSGQITLYTNATTDNLSRLLVTTTTAAPGAGDTIYVVGEMTGAGTGNDITVTMNETATTDYGAVSIGNRGILNWATSASTNYYLKMSGSLNVYAGSKCQIGTTGTPMPSTSTAVLEFDCTSNVEFGIEIHNQSTFIAQGASKTGKTLLTADEAAASTVIDVASTTGWLASDELAFAPTTRTAAEHEKKTISTVDSGTQVTLTAGLTNAHSGTSPTQGEVINITRNIKIRGISSTFQSYVHIEDSPTSVDIDYVEFYQLGSNTAEKNGIVIDDTTGATNIQNCAMHDSTAASSEGVRLATNSAGNTVSNNVFYNIISRGILVQATTGSHTVSGNTVIGGASNGGIDVDDLGSTITNNVIAGTASVAMPIAETGGIIGTISGNTTHSCGGSGVTITAAGGTVSNHTSWRNTGTGLWMSSSYGGTKVDGVTVFGNSVRNVLIDSCENVLLNNITADAGSTLTSPIGIAADNGCTAVVTNSQFGETTAHTTTDINVLASGAPIFLTFQNCLFASTTELNNPASMAEAGYICSLKHDRVAGSHKLWKRYGTLTTDTSIVNGAAPSVRMAPNNASFKLTNMHEPIRVPVTSGSAPVVSVAVRESVSGDGADYNGSRIRLIVKANAAIGINDDTVIDTATIASEGAWEVLSGTCPTPSDDGVMELVVDCDGTTGWVNVDDFAATNVKSTLGAGCWGSRGLVMYGEPAGGDGGVLFNPGMSGGMQRA